MTKQQKREIVDRLTQLMGLMQEEIGLDAITAAMEHRINERCKPIVERTMDQWGREEILETLMLSFASYGLTQYLETDFQAINN